MFGAGLSVCLTKKMRELFGKPVWKQLLFFQFCLVSLEAQLLRTLPLNEAFIVLFCRIGKQFELPLLLQSVVMILTMLVMLHLCCSIQSSNRVSTKQHHITGNHIKQSVSMLFLLVNTTWFNIWLSHTSLKCPIFGGTY